MVPFLGQRIFILMTGCIKGKGILPPAPRRGGREWGKERSVMRTGPGRGTGLTELAHTVSYPLLGPDLLTGSSADMPAT